MTPEEYREATQAITELIDLRTEIGRLRLAIRQFVIANDWLSEDSPFVVDKASYAILKATLYDEDGRVAK